MLFDQSVGFNQIFFETRAAKNNNRETRALSDEKHALSRYTKLRTNCIQFFYSVAERDQNYVARSFFIFIFILQRYSVLTKTILALFAHT